MGNNRHSNSFVMTPSGNNRHSAQAFFNNNNNHNGGDISDPHFDNMNEKIAVLEHRLEELQDKNK